MLLLIIVSHFLLDVYGRNLNFLSSNYEIRNLTFAHHVKSDGIVEVFRQMYNIGIIKIEFDDAIEVDNGSWGGMFPFI